MEITYLLTLVAVIAAGGTITLVASWYLLKKDIRRSFSPELPSSDKKGNAQLLALRLQAHERMIVFIDRLNPSNLFLRLNQPGMTARQLQAVVLNEVRAEYQHNVSQQLYINAETWDVLCKLKDDTIAMINNAVGELSADASSINLSRKILEHVAGIKANPYELTLGLLKQNIHELL